MVQRIARAVCILFIFFLWTSQPVHASLASSTEYDRLNFVDCDQRSEEPELRVCVPGSYLCLDQHDCGSSPLYTCIPCSEGSYISTRNQCAKCSTCASQCMEDRAEETQKCKPDSNRVCTCIPPLIADIHNKCVSTGKSYGTTPVQNPTKKPSTVTGKGTTPGRNPTKKPSTVTGKEQQPSYEPKTTMAEMPTTQTSIPLSKNPTTGNPILMVQGHHIILIITAISSMFLVVIVFAVIVIFCMYFKSRRWGSSHGENGSSQNSQELEEKASRTLLWASEQSTERTPFENGRPHLDLRATNETIEGPTIREPCQNTEAYSPSGHRISAYTVTDQLNSFPPSRASSATSLIVVDEQA